MMYENTSEGSIYIPIHVETDEVTAPEQPTLGEELPFFSQPQIEGPVLGMRRDT